MPDLKRLAAEIAAAGHHHVFGITGSGASLMLADGLEKAGVGFVRTAFEGAAAVMAGTVGRLTGRAGVAVAIKGPGLANLIPGLAVSWFESFPMVGIVEAYAAGSSPAKAHKRMDHHGLVAPVSKGVRVLADEGPGFADAARYAEAERPGPLLLELTGEKGTSERPWPQGVERPAGEAGTALRLVEAARRPVMIAGTLAIRKGWGESLSRLSVPVFSTAAAKGVVDERLPHAAGVYTGVGLELVPEARLLKEADLVICLGVRPAEVLATKPLPCASVCFDCLGDVPGRDAFAFVATADDAAMEDVFAALAGKAWGLDALAECLTVLDTHLRAGPFLPTHTFAVMAEQFGLDVRMVMDTGYFCTIGEHIWRAPSPNLCLLSGQGRYMGTGVPMALAAALVDPSRPTIAVVGDGGIGMYAGELRIAVERRLPLLVVLMTDGRFGSVATRALKDGLTLAPLTVEAPSWMRIMEAMGFHAAAADSATAFREALAQWNPQAGPGYIEVAYAPGPYEKMVERIR